MKSRLTRTAAVLVVRAGFGDRTEEALASLRFFLLEAIGELKNLRAAHKRGG